MSTEIRLDTIISIILTAFLLGAIGLNTYKSIQIQRQLEIQTCSMLNDTDYAFMECLTND